MSRSKSGHFSFNVGKLPVVGLSGDEGRKVFFESKDLGFEEGYAVLFGGVPEVKAANEPASEGSSDHFFSRRITRMLRKDNLSALVPKLVRDTKASLDRLAAAPSKIVDPFDEIYNIVFQLTMRGVGCDEIAEDPKLLHKTLSLYETIENSSTTASIIFPRFPTPAVVKRFVAGARLYMIFQNIATARRKNGVRGTDALQFLLDQGDSMDKIIAVRLSPFLLFAWYHNRFDLLMTGQFVIGALYAGQLNTGINVAWTLAYLAENQHWMQRCREEVDAVIERKRKNPDEKATDVLARFELDEWEGSFSNIDLCLRESIRFQLVGTAFRKNISGRDLPVGDEVIPKDAYVVYALDDIHFDNDIYPNPERWDPGRYLPDRAEDKKKEHAYLGWGTGRHPCLGMKFAKLEQAVIIGHFIAMFDFKLCDSKGQEVKSTPTVSRNAHAAAKPHEPVRLKYTNRGT